MEIFWTHLPIVKPGMKTLQISTFNVMDAETKKRDAIFADRTKRINFLKGINNMAFFEMNALRSNGDKEAGAMMAADIGYRIDNILDQIYKETTLDLF